MSGQEIYEAVEVMLASGQAKDKQAAFAVVAEQTGVKPSNVAGNYYRHAKKIGAPIQPRKRRARSGPTSAAGSRASTRAADRSDQAKRWEEDLAPESANERGPIQTALADLTAATAKVVEAVEAEQTRQAKLIATIRETIGQ